MAFPQFNTQVAGLSGGPNLYGVENATHWKTHDIGEEEPHTPTLGTGPSEVSQRFAPRDIERPLSPGNPLTPQYHADFPGVGRLPGRNDGLAYSSGGAFPEMGDTNAMHSHPWSSLIRDPEDPSRMVERAHSYRPSSPDYEVVENSTRLFQEENLPLPNHNIQVPAIPLRDPRPGETTHLENNFLRVYPEGYGVVRPNPDPVGNPNPPVRLDKFNRPDPGDKTYPPVPLYPPTEGDAPPKIYPGGSGYRGAF